MKAKHRDNLLKLAAYLETLPDDYEQFDMREYMMVRNVNHRGHHEVLRIDERSKPVCGTVACAVGHGPSAGIRVYGDECWGSYADRVFGYLPDSGFDYMFASGWSVDDNTPKGAAARIRTYVTLGHAPDDWSYFDAKVLS